MRTKCSVMNLRSLLRREKRYNGRMKQYAIYTILFVILTFGGLFGYVRYQTYKNSSQEPVIAPAEINGITNWKNYRNRQYGFEFQYPTDWSLTLSRYQDKSYPVALSMFSITGPYCQITLVPSGGRGLGDEWKIKDEVITAGGKRFNARFFYFKNYEHLRWVSLFNFPTLETELQLYADARHIDDISPVCLYNFRKIVATVKWL